MEVVTSSGKTAQALLEANWSKRLLEFGGEGYVVLEGAVVPKNSKTNSDNYSAVRMRGLPLPARVNGNYVIDYQPEPLDLSGSNATVQRLSVAANKLQKNGQDFTLRGVSLLYADCLWTDFSGIHRLNMIGHAFEGMNCVRVPCSTSGDPAYSNYGLENYLTWFVDPVVSWTERNGMYCIIDWHSTGTTWTDAAIDTSLKSFWDVVADRYKNLPHVIFEIYNEPDSPHDGFQQSSWDEFKPTVQGWVDYVRNIAPDTLILAPTPLYSQFVRYVPNNPLSGSNIAYVHHVYPGHVPGGSVVDFQGVPTSDATNEQKYEWIIDNICEASLSVPVVVTEWGYDLSDTGFYLIHAKSRNSFAIPLLAKFTEYGVSWTAWSLDPNGGPSLLSGNNQLSDFGAYVSGALAQ